MKLRKSGRLTLDQVRNLPTARSQLLMRDFPASPPGFSLRARAQMSYDSTTQNRSWPDAAVRKSPTYGLPHQEETIEVSPEGILAAGCVGGHA